MLRFFAFFDRYLEFGHSVREFLNQYSDDANKSFNHKRGEKVFADTFLQLANVLPDTIRRASRRGTTPLNLFEGVAVGAALAWRKAAALRKEVSRLGWHRPSCWRSQRKEQMTGET